MTVQNGHVTCEVLVMRPWHLHHGIRHKCRDLTSYNKYGTSTDDNMQIRSRPLRGNAEIGSTCYYDLRERVKRT